MKLSHLTDLILLNDTKFLVRTERKSTTEILHHLKEIDRRRLYTDLKYSSLFKYCLKELGYSEASAQRRIVAARLLDEIPEIEEKLESGALNLTNISQVNQHFKDSSTEEKLKVLEIVEGLSKRECEKKLFELTGKVEPSNEGTRRLTKDKVQLNLVVTDETFELVDKVRSLFGREMSSDELIKYLATAAIEKFERERFKTTDKPRTTLSPAKVGRAVPAHVKREVFERDQCCTLCGSIENLNFDHRHAFAHGGTSGIENIRLLCFQCNQRSRVRAKL